MTDHNRSQALDERIAAHADGYSRRVPLWWTIALRQAKAGIMARDVLAVIASYADEKGEAYPSIATIAATLGVGEKAVKGGLHELKVIGLLTSTMRNRRAGESNLYQVQVTNPVTKSELLGHHFEPDQVTISGQYQGSELSTNRAKNSPVELTNERSLSEKDETDETLGPLIALMELCGKNGQAEQEARSIAETFPSPIERERFVAWVHHARSKTGIPNPVGYAIKCTHQSIDPPKTASRSPEYPVLT